MNKYSAVYFDDINAILKLRLATVIFVNGVTNEKQSQVFSSVRIKYWMKDLKVKHPDHPVIEDFKTVLKFLRKEKIDLVIC